MQKYNICCDVLLFWEEPLTFFAVGSSTGSLYATGRAEDGLN